MATCFGAVCMVWQHSDSLSDQPPPSNISFIGFRVRNAVQNQWLDGEEAATTLQLCNEYTDVPAVKGHELAACLSQFLSLVGLPPFYLAPVVQVIHSKAAAIAYEATNGGGIVTPIIMEIPFLWFFPAQEVQAENNENENEDEDEDEDENEDEITDEVVSIILEEGTEIDIDIDIDVDVDVDMVVPATEASIEALGKFNLEVVRSDDKCMICLDQLSVEIEVSRMPCSHVFHGDCIVQWLKSSHICPLCRFQMPID